MSRMLHALKQLDARGGTEPPSTPPAPEPPAPMQAPSPAPPAEPASAKGRLGSPPGPPAEGSPAKEPPGTSSEPAIPKQAAGPLRDPRFGMPSHGTAPADPAARNEPPGPRFDLIKMIGQPPQSQEQQYRETARNILAQLSSGRCWTLMLLGLTAGEEHDAVAVRLGAVFADETSGVLLVDGKFHRPTLSASAGIRCRRSLTDLLVSSADWREAISATNVQGLHVMRTEPFPGDGQPPENLRFAPVAEQWRRQYRLVLVHAEISAHPEVLRLSRYCDATYLLVQLQHTRRRTAKDALRRIAEYGGQVAGCVLIGDC